MKIHLRNIINEGLTNSSGNIAFLEVRRQLLFNENLNIDCKGVKGYSSSFLNSFVGELIEDSGFVVLKKIRFSGLNTSETKIFKRHIDQLKRISV